MDTEKYPELRAVSDALRAEKEGLLVQTKALRKQRDAVKQKINELQQQDRELTAQIRAVELPRMVDIDNQLAALARATGARSMGGVDQ